MSLENQDVEKITKIVVKCWDFNNNKKKDVTYHNAENYDEESGITHLLFCPSKKEIVGGSRDGKVSFSGFMFHIGMFLDLCKTKKIEVVDVAFSTRNKHLECETLIFHILYKKKQYAVKIYGKPAKDVNVTTRINYHDIKGS
jgi:hypothetical protein